MYKKILSIFITLAICIFFTGCEKTAKTEKIKVHLSVAASLKDPFLKIEELYEKEHKNVDLILNFGSSGALKQQIVQGAPCDVFISASVKYMDELKNEEYLLDDSYNNFTKNELVLVSKTNEIYSIEDLKNDKYKKIGIGDLNTVPVGQYADEVLKNKNIKKDLEDKFVYAKDAKEVLAWTLSSNVDAGFLYSSDISKYKDVNIYKIDSSLHSPIIYPIGVIKNSKQLEESIKIKDFLLSENAKKILGNYGYTS